MAAENNLDLADPLPGRVNLSSAPAWGWDVLDRLAADLGRCQDRQAATRRFLAAVQEGLAADIVFYTQAGASGAVEVVGRPVTADWCRAVVRVSLAGSPGAESQVLLSRWPTPTGWTPPFLGSAALVRLGRSGPAWAVAVRFSAEKRFGPDDVTLMSLARRLLADACERLRAQSRLRQTVLGLVQGFTETIDGRDRYTAGHSDRTARIAVRLGEQMGLSGADLGDLCLTALLHDVGAVRTGEQILHKPGPLTPEEEAVVREHPVFAAAIVSRVAPLARLAPIVRAHHERWDGTGYPDGLAGDRIPLLARVLAVADSCDALLAPRPYRDAATPAELEALLRAGAGLQWDPAVVRCFLACRNEACAVALFNPPESAKEPL